MSFLAPKGRHHRNRPKTCKKHICLIISVEKHATVAVSMLKICKNYRKLRFDTPKPLAIFKFWIKHVQLSHNL